RLASLASRRRFGAAVPQASRPPPEAARHRGQIRDRLRQGVIFLRYAGTLIPGPRSLSAGAGLVLRGVVARLAAVTLRRAGAVLLALLAGQLPGAPAEGDEVPRPYPPPRPGEQPGHGGGCSRVV